MMALTIDLVTVVLLLAITFVKAKLTTYAIFFKFRKFYLRSWRFIGKMMDIYDVDRLDQCGMYSFAFQFKNFIATTIAWQS